MPTTTAPLHHRPQPRMDRLRHRAELPALAQPARAHVPSLAENDFLVPNPRPDLTLDPHTLRMIERRSFA